LENTQQSSLADALVIEHKSLSELDDVHIIINWNEIEKTLSSLYSSVPGAPAYPPLMMFKILILQAWYNLSDEALEKQIARDLMFRRFIDLSLCEPVPDHSSIWRFRQLLNTENLLEPLLEQINTHLEQNSIIVALGSINIIDATVIEAKQSRKRKGKDDNNTQDPEASYNVKTAVMMLTVILNSNYIGRYNWSDTGEYERMRKAGSFKGSSLVLVGAAHTLRDTRKEDTENKKAFPAFKHMGENPSIAVTPKSVIDEASSVHFDPYRNNTSMAPDFGVWVESKQGPKVGTFLVHDPESLMREIFGNIIEKVSRKLTDLSQKNTA